MARSSGGMLAISNTKPDSITAGRKAAISAACAALNWLRITVERNSPSPRALPRKTLVTRKSSSRGAAPRHRHYRHREEQAEQHGDDAKAIVGQQLGEQQLPLVTGVASSASMVPRSHSRATTSEVSRAL